MDIVSVYLALALGAAAFWWGLFRNYPLEDCLVRALAAMAAVYAAGLLARLVMALFLAFGGRKNGGGKASTEGAARDRAEGEEVREA